MPPTGRPLRRRCRLRRPRVPRRPRRPRVPRRPAPDPVAHTSAPEPEPPSPEAARRSPWPLIAWGIAILCAIIAVVVLVASGGGSKHSSSESASASATTAAHPTTSGSATAPAAAPALQPLPGGPAGLGGTLAVQRGSGTPRLALRIHGLASPGAGHYELWLYNSIIDSRPLAVVPVDGTVDVTLPAGYRHFQWLDVSLQPAGAVGHSGISVLRAATPQ